MFNRVVFGRIGRIVRDANLQTQFVGEFLEVLLEEIVPRIVTAAAIRMGKHVYVQKPLTHTVYESRKLAELAREYKVATQMGNQGNSGEGIRQAVEMIWDGAITGCLTFTLRIQRLSPGEHGFCLY